MTNQTSSEMTLPQEHIEDIPLPNPCTVEALLILLRKILSKSVVRRVVIQERMPVRVHWEGIAGETLEDAPEPRAASHVRTLELRVQDPGGSAAEQLGKAVLFLESHGLHVSHTVVGEESQLWEWLGLDLRRVSKFPERVAGGLLVRDPEYAPFLMFLLAGPSPVGPLRDAERAVMITMETVEAESA